MIELYYCSDLGMLTLKQDAFKKKHCQILVINPKNYEHLFEQLEQTSLFFQPQAYLICQLSMLGMEWKNMTQIGDNSDQNTKYIKRLHAFLVNCKTAKIPVLITVHSHELLKNQFIKEILDLITNTKPKLVLLNSKTKANHLNNLLHSHKVQLDDEAKIYFYELFPKNLEFILNVFEKIKLYNQPVLSFKELQQLVGNNKEGDFYKLVDLFLENKVIDWLIIFKNKCISNEDANALLNILVFKINEFYHFLTLMEENHDFQEITTMMHKSDFMLYNYRRIARMRPNFLQVIKSFVLKLFEYCLGSRTLFQVSSHNLKQLLLILID